ncbi:putative laminin domain protein [Rhizoctonia solani 123E]|uniref:Putative laminin domain protein n=1 Tax=Rhizoctonia solani 123E TaxID=1423351 RepID=A0A074S0W1_9AGAM|nr:putative laminin domain protein [Rhizoctonia solani 123E]
MKPILGNPSRGEVKLVHEAVRALNNVSHTPGLRDTDLSIELSQHLFDIQMRCHQQKYPTSVLPNDVVYDPPTLPAYIPVELKSVTGPPSNEEVASVHTALRISESFANVPSMFDPDAHAQLSQHLFDIQLARHVQRSMVKQPAPANSAPNNQTVSAECPGEMDANDSSRNYISSSSTPGQAVQSTETRLPPLEQQSSSREPTSHQNPSETNEQHRATNIMIEIRDALKNVTQILVGTQNSLARGFNSSTPRTAYGYTDKSHNLGAHSLINAHGEVPETYNLPTFALTSQELHGRVAFSVDNLTENMLARYLRFYSIGEEMIDEGEELTIKSGMLDDAKRLLSGRLFLNR